MSSNNPVTPVPEQPGQERSILTDLKGSGEAPVMPDLGGVGATPAKSKYKVHSQTLVIALVLAASGAALYTMRKQGMGSGIQFSNIKVDYDMDKKGRPINDAQERRVLSDLERLQNPSQSAQEKIQKNPFQLDSTSAVAQQSVDPAAVSAAMLKAQQEERARTIADAIAKLEVTSILEGKMPVARINGKSVREGDMITELLKLAAIHDRSVDVEADGKLYTVNMLENAPGKGRPPAPRK